MRAIGIVAERGAGKGLFMSLVKKLLTNTRVASVRFSDPIADTLVLLGKEKTRFHFSIVTTALREAFHDEGILIGAVRSRVAALDADIVVIDGLRKPEEVSLVREFDGVLVAIVADVRTRFERRRRDAEKKDEETMSWEQFLAHDTLASEVSIRTIVETMADGTIENNGTVQEFEEKIKTFLTEQGFR